MMTSSDDGRSQAHYDRLAAEFDQNWAYSSPYVAWMTRCITGRAQLSRGDRVADIGCGTGLYSRGLGAAAGQVACADPSAAMLAQLPPGPELIPVQASAQDIAAHRVRLPWPELDAIIIKEAVHHIPARDRPQVLQGLVGLLAPGGRIVIAMLPARISYPLFSAALDLFHSRQPDPAGIEHILAGTGLTTGLDYDSFPLSFPKTRYLQMVRDRYISLLAEFTDAELGDGLAEISAGHHGDTVEFPDTFAFITGRNPGTPAR